MTSHTPGPWLVEGEDEPVSGIPAIMIARDVPGGPDAKMIAAVDCTMIERPGKREKWVLTDEDWANAALISAAPDLLAALEGVLRVADRKTAEFDAARAAIAKARTMPESRL